MAKKKNSSKDKRVLIAALLVAGVTIAGSTFAWFTSQDEVTNRLTASADYGVSVVEDFTPPEDWTPGQKINKDVSAVNTGNVAAFTRLGLLYDSKLTVADDGVAVPESATAASSADKASWVELKKVASTTNTPTGGNAVNNSANEVSLLQAGGALVVAAGAVVTPSDKWNERSGDDETATDYSGASQYKPSKTGLYIFKRMVYAGDGETTTKYSGYYYLASGTNGADDASGHAGEGKYYALETEPGTVYIANIDSDAVQEDVNGVVTLKSAAALDNIQIANTKEVTIANAVATPAFAITWIQSDGTTAAAQADKSDAKYIRLTYVGNDDTSANKALDDVVIDIELVADWATNWTYKANGTDADRIDSTNDTGFFYYNKILAPGATTEKLVESVTLNKDVTQEAYKELQFDLSVILDSIQVSPDEAKSNDSYVTAVNAAGWGATASYNGTAVSWS